MKKTIGIIIITILTIVSCISTGMAIYLSKNYIKIPSQYRCESNEQIIDNVTYKQIIILNINKEQYIEDYQSKNTTIFSSQEQYQAAKTIENTDNVTYSFDDERLILIADYGTNYIKNSDGVKIDIWYKDYIKNLETTGFTCKVEK